MNKQRLTIFFFFDKDGIVDRYINNLLESMQKVSDKIVIVANGILSPEGKELFSKYSKDIIIRENIGFDVWAYKTALEYIDWDKLREYYEVVLMNYTIMGPVFPLIEMFNKMDQRSDLDFWGITKCFELKNPVAQEMWNCPYGYIPEHIQSSFMVYRNKFMQSKDIEKYWTNMPPINSYYEAGGIHEQVFTKYFNDLGYIWDCYTNFDNINKSDSGCCPLITDPIEIVINRKSPFFKRRTFFTSKSEYHNIRPIYNEFIQELKSLGYDTDLIYETLIRTCNQRILVDNFLNFHLI